MRLSSGLVSWCRRRTLQETVRSLSGVARQTNENNAAWTTTHDLVEELTNRIIFQDNNIVVLDKPSGLPMQALKYTANLPPDVKPAETEDLSVAACLPGLAIKLETPQLTPAYSQNRLYSGILVLAKHEESARMMQKYFRHTRAQKLLYQNYWAVTLGIPEDRTRTVELSVRREEIHDWRLSVLGNHVSNRERKTRDWMQPLIHHKILDSNPRFDVAFTQLQPTMTKWDVLQVYLNDILTPPLGDHVYSSRVALIMDRRTPVHPQSAYPKPQVVPHDVLRVLEYEGGSTAVIPLHIHCQSVTLPVMIRRRRGAAVSQNKTFTTPPPPFFLNTMKRLGLRLPLVEQS